jgi:gluconolactonase
LENRLKNLLIVLLLLTSFLFAQSPIPSGAKLEKVYGSGKQLEGPVWKDGLGLLFSDIKAAKIYLLPSDGSAVKTYLEKSDSSNGLTLDKSGNLILTQMGKRRVSRQESNGNITVLADKYNGKRFNSPNDLVVKSDGSIFFTDPDFNIPTGGTKEILINGVYVRGVYRLSSKGNLQLLDATFDKPNGICFSPDEKKLYVNESPLGKIYVWDVVDDSTITNKKLLYTIPLGGYSDGMKVDTGGNIFCTGPTAVWIVSPAGVLLDKIVTTSFTTENPSNCTWGDADKKTLYITTNSNLFRIKLTTTGVEGNGSILPNKFDLFQNYPNPFNPETIITYRLSEAGNVSLKIYDAAGKEVDTLINKYQQAGTYNSKFSIRNSLNGSLRDQLPSGIYFYTLSSNNYSQTLKMIVLK